MRTSTENLIAATLSAADANVRESLLDHGRVVVKSLTSAPGVIFPAPPPPDGPPIVDAAGHRRPAYAGLLVRAWAVAHVPGLDRWRTRLRAELADIDLPPAGFTAAAGSTASTAAWHALALATLGEVDLASPVFEAIAAGQQPSGQLLKTTSHDNPETHWYHELVVLHALTSYAITTRNGVLLQRVERAADFHLSETQPDHATNQPWAIHAFSLRDQTAIFGEQLLHAGVAQHPGGLDAVSLMLLADALYCLRLSRA